jgi:bifunctional DNA primase/polymerase-like protein/DnaB helicase-like protein/primase-like protein
MITDTLDFARAYAGLKWQSFPCLPRDKKPLVKWADVATIEDNMLVGWWDTNPAANIGIACGKRSGIVVVDIDADHDGYESLAELAVNYGALPETPMSKTGSGGRHIFFRHPGVEIRNSAGKLGKGIDIRGDGGYVVAPPSIHPNGNRYEWIVKPSQCELATMPEWMIELLRERNIITESQTVTGRIISGERNNALTRMAGAMRRKDFDEDQIFLALKDYNLKKCQPPLTDGEVLQIARSVVRYEPQDAPKIIPPLPDAWDVMQRIEGDILERQRNPVDVWGIHYAWKYLSLVTGGKQKGELTILAGEPKIGKSYWAHQDFLYGAIGNPKDGIPSTPSLIWSGEMSRRQVYRRFIEMLGVPKRHMLNGQMSAEDWQFFNEAKALIVNSPIYVSDAALNLEDVKPMLEREISEHGIEQALFDYDWLIHATGRDEIQTSQNISRALKQLARELNIAITLISSVNKMGMDTTSENVTKTNVSGSGKKLHDADVIYILTRFNEKKNSDLSISARDYEKIVTLHIAAAREMDYQVPGGAINYMRETPNPRFREMKDITKSDSLPAWVTRKDLA